MENTTPFPAPQAPQTRRERLRQEARNRQIGRHYMWNKTKKVAHVTVLTAGTLALVSMAAGALSGSNQDKSVPEEN